MHKPIVKWLVTIGIGVLIFLLPRPEAVTVEAWTLLAIFIATIVGSIVQPLTGSAMVLLGVVAVALFRAVPIEKALSGYADKFVWLVLAAFFISRAMIKTGLGHRIALIFVRLIGKKTLGLGYSLVFTDLILASFIPSTGARSGGIILPIARSVTETYDSRPDDGTAGRLGTFLMTMLYQCEVILCATFLTGQASNVIIAGFAAKQANVDLNYSIWFISAIVPAMVSLTIIPLMIYRLYPPEVKETPNAVSYATEELRKLGALNRSEKTLLIVFVAVVIMWITAKWHGIDSTVVALVGISGLLVTGVLEWRDLIDETHAWEVFIWYGGLVMMATALGETNVTTLFANGIAATISGVEWPIALAILGLIFFYAHYAFASITAHVTAMFIPFLAVTIALGAPAGLTVLLLTYFANLSAGLTHYGTTPAPVYFGLGYVTQTRWWTVGLIASILNIIIWSTVGLFWWKLIGWW
ncbi:MAG TPA: DASS family sodium-coupled anion symporter [Pyrinomonadaceae bacterium]|nr:DASS family sodium-coupled anion symporter [Chloracidobacterium sp.]HBE81545.1 anion permease [Blastocatellia bacterium]HRJ89059.1 DASS family sodium-coupled anion symporter [Pyrinomonadaceae bacterium]HRK49943.1 DASS family sodium-coupled anion symporter [Pyrinomonadaceae bacterium]